MLLYLLATFRKDVQHCSRADLIKLILVQQDDGLYEPMNHCILHVEIYNTEKASFRPYIFTLRSFSRCFYSIIERLKNAGFWPWLGGREESLQASTWVLNWMRAATGSQWREQRSGAAWEQLRRLSTTWRGGIYRCRLTAAGHRQGSCQLLVLKRNHTTFMVWKQG